MSWVSPKGTPLGEATLAKVDEKILAELYATEGSGGVGGQRFDVAYGKANVATRHAWNLGYKNPRVQP